MEALYFLELANIYPIDGNSYTCPLFYFVATHFLLEKPYTYIRLSFKIVINFNYSIHALYKNV